MKPLAIYCSIKGHTKLVVGQLDCRCVAVDDRPILTDYNPVLWFCPTYGDEELPRAMEDFLDTIEDRGKCYGICELGNYYGYDDYEFGAMKIIKSKLDSLGWHNNIPNLSLDSLPKIDWVAFNRWKNTVYGILYHNTFSEGGSVSPSS